MSQIDTTHPVWLALKRQIQGRIEELRLQLEKPASPDETNATRGRIAELRKMLRDVEPPEKDHRHQSPIY